MVVHLQSLAQRERLIGEKELIARAVDNDGVGLPQVIDGAERHLAGRAYQRGVVQAHQYDDTKGAVRPLGPRLAFEQRHGPFHTGDAAHAVDIVIRERLHFIEVLGVRIHHPDTGVANVLDLAPGPIHDAREDRALVRHQKRREGDGEDQAQVLGAISE